MLVTVSWELGHDVELPTFKDADGTTRYIEGTAFAIARDVADFLGSTSAEVGGISRRVSRRALNGVILFERRASLAQDSTARRSLQNVDDLGERSWF
jgi:hypothetical protein